MPTKKHTSTKKPQSAVPQQPAISESALRFTTRFLMHAKCLSGEQQHDDPLQLAFEVFVGWPNEFWMRHQEQGVVPPLDDHAFRQLLAQAHEAATRVLMRAAESRGLDSSAISAIWTASRIARDAILTRTNFHLPAGGWSRPWPECLGPELRTMPDWQQQAIVEAEAVLTQLGTMLDAPRQNEPPEGESGIAATLAATLAAVQVGAPDLADEIKLARNQDIPLVDRLAELFRRFPRFRTTSNANLGRLCNVSREAIRKTIKNSEALQKARDRTNLR